MVELPDTVKGARIVAVTTVPLNEKEVMQKLTAELPPLFLPKKFVVLPDIPKMGSGKVDFRTTTKRVAEMEK